MKPHSASQSPPQRQRQYSDLHNYKQLRRTRSISGGLSGLPPRRTHSGSLTQAACGHQRCPAHDLLAVALVLSGTVIPVAIINGGRAAGKIGDSVLGLMASMTLPIQLTAFLLHLLVGRSLSAEVPVKLGRHDACWMSGCLSRLCCWGKLDGRDYERSVRALPTRWIWLHFLLFT